MPTESPRGVKSDYRAERWATRVDYVQRNLGDWLMIALLIAGVLVAASLYIGLALNMWFVGSGWATILMLGIPLVWIGWQKATDWSRRTLNRARRERGEGRYGYDDGYRYEL